MAEHSGKLFVGTEDGVYYAKDQKKPWAIIPGTKGKVITAVHSSKKYMLFGTKNGEALMYSKGKILGIRGGVIPKRAITAFATIGPQSQTLLLGSFGSGVVLAFAMAPLEPPCAYKGRTLLHPYNARRSVLFDFS